MITAVSRTERTCSSCIWKSGSLCSGRMCRVPYSDARSESIRDPCRSDFESRCFSDLLDQGGISVAQQQEENEKFEIILVWPRQSWLQTKIQVLALWHQAQHCEGRQWRCRHCCGHELHQYHRSLESRDGSTESPSGSHSLYLPKSLSKL